jgi:hypothetical protein
MSIHHCRPVMEAVCYYVTAQNGVRTAFLLGPFPSHAEALAEVERGKELAMSVDPFAWFYAYGTATGPASRPVRVLFTEAAP